MNQNAKIDPKNSIFASLCLYCSRFINSVSSKNSQKSQKMAKKYIVMPLVSAMHIFLAFSDESATLSLASSTKQDSQI